MSPLRILTGLSLFALIASLGAACGDDESTSSSTTSGSGTTTTTTGSGSTSSGGMCSFDNSGGFGPFGDICSDQAGDTACVTCARANCCTQVQACEQTECACLFDCFLSGECPETECILVCPVDNPEAEAVIQCAINECGADCVPQ